LICCLRNYIDEVVEGVSAENLFIEIPTIHFFPQEDFCPVNKTVLKTREKKVVTMDIGAFRAKETVMQSQEDRKIYTCHSLKSLAPHRCTFGYDVIVYVGYALFVHCRSEKDIVNELATKTSQFPIEKSAFSARNLSPILLWPIEKVANK